MTDGIPPRKYYSVRTGTNPDGPTLSLNNLKILFASAYLNFSVKDYWHQSFGYYCVDQDNVPGEIGSDVSNYMLLCLHKSNIWPISDRVSEYSEDDLFDVIEFLHDHISKPIEGTQHTYNDCGMHWHKFDKVAGQVEYRAWINRLLERYGSGYEITSQGEIMSLGPAGVSTLYAAKLPSASKTISNKVQAAVVRFRRYASSIEDRQQAVRELADVLEFVRKEIKVVLLKKDENDLFELANKFGIRHFNETQKLEYDRVIWLSWIFYYYLATIHAFFHLAERQRSETSRQLSNETNFSSKFLDELKACIAINTVVGGYVKLIRAGREWKGCCPFHNEKSPSFYVNAEKGFYHCFGCGTHGDVIQFVMKQDNLSFGDAVKLLASQAGMTISR